MFELVLKLQVSDEDLDVIEHVVAQHPRCVPGHPDYVKGERIGEAWVRHCWRELGIDAPRAIAAKVNKYRGAYLAARQEATDKGVLYLNAAACDLVRRSLQLGNQPAVAKLDAPAPAAAARSSRAGKPA